MLIEMLLLFTSGFFFAETQIIREFQLNVPNRMPLFLFPFWIENRWKYDNAIVQWLMRYPLAWFKDGYHLSKGLAISLLAISALIGINFINPIIDFVTVSGVIGLGFNIRFHLWR